jgi:hypothetical protein
MDGFAQFPRLKIRFLDDSRKRLVQLKAPQMASIPFLPSFLLSIASASHLQQLRLLRPSKIRQLPAERF